MFNLFSYPDNAKVMIFASDQLIDQMYKAEIQSSLDRFTQSWISHNRLLRAIGGIIHDRFIVFVIDETEAGTSGCSTDKAFHFIQDLGSRFKLNFLDRSLQYYYDAEEDTIRSVNIDDIKDKIEKTKLNESTLFVNLLAKTKKEYLNRFFIEMKESWLKRYLES